MSTSDQHGDASAPGTGGGVGGAAVASVTDQGPNQGDGTPGSDGGEGNDPTGPMGGAGSESPDDEFVAGGGAGSSVSDPSGGGAAGSLTAGPNCGNGTLDEGEECDPGDFPSSEAGSCNESCALNACSENETRPCAEGGALGNCALGTQVCMANVWSSCDVVPAAADSCETGDDADCDGVANEGCDCMVGTSRKCSSSGAEGNCADGDQVCQADGTFGPCDVQPAAADSCETPGDDADCDGVANGGCDCVAGTTQKCSISGAEGNCANGDQVCQADGTFGPCDIQPAAADSCASPGDDANCDGVPNGGCECNQEGAEEPCGPATETGVCAFGVTRCEDGGWTECTGAVFPAARNCASSADNDCNGSPDNTVSGTCVCSVGTTRVCGAHPGQDGYGMCEAGEQMCEASADGSSSYWGTCIGSVAPQPADSCAVEGDDGDCDGATNDGCDCVQGNVTTCAAEYGRQGDCGEYQLTCAANGRWPAEASACAAQSGDSCAPAGQCLGGVWDSPSATFDDVCFQ